jgi:hypothetical protein
MLHPTFRLILNLGVVKKAAKLDAASKLELMQTNTRVIKHYRSALVAKLMKVRDDLDCPL